MNEQNNLKQIYDKNIKLRGYKGFDQFFTFKDNKCLKVDKQIIQSGIQNIVVIKQFDFNEYINGLFITLQKYDNTILNNWFKNFTKSIFLYGNPNKLNKYLNDFKYHSENIAISGPEPTKKYNNIIHLLRRVKTYQMYNLKNFTYNRAGIKTIHIHMSLDGLLFERVLVHLTHTIVECYILGIINKESKIVFRNYSEIEQRDDYEYARVDIDETNFSQLKLYTQLIRNSTKIK